MKRFRKQAIGAGIVLPALIGLAGCGAASTPAQTATNLVTQGLKAQLSGDLATAARDYQQAIKADRYNMVAHYDLGTIYDRQGNAAQAVAEYNATLVINPAFADALFNLAVDTSAAQPVAAEQLYLKVVSVQPTFAAAWLNLGFILQREGRAAEATADWARAVQLDHTLASRLPSPSPSPSAGASPAAVTGTGTPSPSATP